MEALQLVLEFSFASSIFVRGNTGTAMVEPTMFSRYLIVTLLYNLFFQSYISRN